jgi:GNAT superfamily N-acetyltransferase
MILQFTRRLEGPPVVEPLLGVSLRQFEGESDILCWLRLRAEAFADEKPGVRNWTAADFSREFLGKSWWHPEAIWFAMLQDRTVGSIAIARRRDNLPALNWLMVSPDCRGQGIARLLVSAAERALWDEGQHQIWLETHSQWKSAVKFYCRAGYANAIPPGPSN